MTEVWYLPETDEILVVTQRMMDEWVIEELSFYSHQYWHIPIYAFHDDAVFVGWL